MQFIEDLITKTKHKRGDFDAWKTSVISKAKEKITYLKNTLKPPHTKQTLKDTDVLSYLESLQKKYVIVAIDKAANSFAFIWKKFYINKLLSEISDNNTYLHTEKSKDSVIEENTKICEK